MKECCQFKQNINTLTTVPRKEQANLLTLLHNFQNMTHQISSLELDLNDIDDRIQMLEVPIDYIQSLVTKNQDIQTPLKECKKKRRTADLVERGFDCPYPKCNKSYGTDISLNLHIRLKHNGGSKIEREELAQKMLIALLNDEQPPKHSLNLPPDFLKEFCHSYAQFTKNLEQTYKKQINL